MNELKLLCKEVLEEYESSRTNPFPNTRCIETAVKSAERLAKIVIVLSEALMPRSEGWAHEALTKANEIARGGG